jgi:CRP-like cAMP-binding protein
MSHVNNAISSNPGLLDLARKVPTVFFERGCYLMREGEIGEHSFVILSGNVAIEFENPSLIAPTSLPLLRGHGFLVGELSLFGHSRCASVIALDRVTCAKIPHAILLQLISTDPKLALAILEQIMDKVR